MVLSIVRVKKYKYNVVCPNRVAVRPALTGLISPIQLYWSD